MASETDVPTESEVISLTIAPEHRSRFRARMTGKKTRIKLLDKLNHYAPIDDRHATWFDSIDRAIASINVPQDTHTILISSDANLDGKSLPLSEALTAVADSGFGTIIGISKSLAIYCDEFGTRNVAVIRKTS